MQQTIAVARLLRDLVYGQNNLSIATKDDQIYLRSLTRMPAQTLQSDSTA